MKYSNMLTIFSNDSHVPMFLVTPVLVKPSSLQQLNRNAHRGSKLRVSHCHAVNLCNGLQEMDRMVKKEIKYPIKQIALLNNSKISQVYS